MAEGSEAGRGAGKRTCAPHAPVTTRDYGRHVNEKISSSTGNALRKTSKKIRFFSRVSHVTRRGGKNTRKREPIERELDHFRRPTFLSRAKNSYFGAVNRPSP